MDQDLIAVSFKVIYYKLHSAIANDILGTVGITERTCAEQNCCWNPTAVCVITYIPSDCPSLYSLQCTEWSLLLLPNPCLHC